MYPGVIPLWELYERHLEEAAFLWGQWERALMAWDRRLEQVVSREGRLLAHVDALALGGEEGARRFLLPATRSEEPPRAAAAALALLQQDGVAGRDAVLAALVEGPPEALPGLQWALEVCGREDVLPGLSSLLAPDAEPLRTAVALEVHAAHRRGPAVSLLPPWLEHSESTVVAAASRVLPFVTPTPTAPLLHGWRQAVESSEPELRDRALVSGAMLGLRAAWARCLQLVEARDAPGRLPLLLLAMGGGPKEQRLLLELLGEAGTRADAAWALGHSGRFEAAEACLDLLADADARVARLATESFAAITGFPLEGPHVLPEPEEEAEEPDAPVLPEEEALLPRVEAATARAWWAQACKLGRFKPGARYLAGEPFSASALVRAFSTEPARRWPALALELAIRSRGQLCVSARDLSARRHRQLAAFKGFAPRGEQPFSSLLDQ